MTGILVEGRRKRKEEKRRKVEQKGKSEGGEKGEPER